MEQVSAAASTPGLGAKITHRLLTRSPLGLLVRWVARIQASVHAKLLGGSYWSYCCSSPWER